MFWFRKRSQEVEEKRADRAIEDLKESLLAVLGGSLKSLVVYGSRASGEYREGHSDINVLLIMDDIHWQNLHRMEAPLKAWVKHGHSAPMLLQADELTATALALPIEFMDMQDHHLVLHGTDPFASLAMDDRNLRSQVTQQLVLRQQALRQSLVLCGEDPKRMREILFDSFSSILTLLRAVLRLKMKASKLRKIDAADRLAELVGYEPAVLHRIHERKIRRAEDELSHVARNVLGILERVIQFLGRA